MHYATLMLLRFNLDPASDSRASGAVSTWAPSEEVLFPETALDRVVLWDNKLSSTLYSLSSTVP